MQHNYKVLMDHLLSMPSCTLITTGRTGSDLLQSLLDSHTEVLTFNGHLWFYDFWGSAYSLNTATPVLSDIIDEFIWKHIHQFKSVYDYTEQKDKLGQDGDQAFEVDITVFKEYFLLLMTDRKVESKIVLLAIYGAYNLFLGHDLTKKKVFFHHIHNQNRLPEYIKDFPNSKVICMTRDPRANFVSGVLHHRVFSVSTDNESHLFYYLLRIIRDAYILDPYIDNCNLSIVVRLEDLGKKCILRSLCDWLDISFEETLMHSTWAGIQWGGDRLSRKPNTESGFSAKMLENSWEDKLSFLDKYLLNFLMNDRLKNYNYEYSTTRIYDFLFVPALILLPLRFEQRFFSYSYIKENNWRTTKDNMLYYLKRVVFLYYIFFRKVGGFKFSKKYIKCD